MISLRSMLSSIFAEAFTKIGLDGRFGEVVVSQRPDLSHFQCNGALVAARKIQKPPRELALAIVDSLSSLPQFSELSIAGPGFINITISDDFLIQKCRELTTDSMLGCAASGRPRNIVIDFGGPNVAKPMHVGHLRSALIGDSLQRIFRFYGEHVISDIHLGDWGTQMGMLICEIGRRYPHLSYFDPNYCGPYPQEPPITIDELDQMYPLASARCNADKAEMAKALEATVELQSGRAGYRALWRHIVSVSVQQLKKEFSLLGITFDLWNGESNYHERIPLMIEKLQKHGYAQQSQGAIVIHLSESDAVSPKPPLILQKSDGGYLYATTDLATLIERVEELKADCILYVVDKRQALHFEQVFDAARLASLAPNTELVHVQFGTVNGVDGKPFKTRAGGVMKLGELIDIVTKEAVKKMDEASIARDYPEQQRAEIASKVAIAALKFADLSNFRTSDYVFDIEKFTSFEGKTGPYLLYTAVRIKSILRKASQRGICDSQLTISSDIERRILLTLCQFADAFAATIKDYAPNYLCEYCYNLAQEFNRFYMSCNILREQEPAVRGSWLAMCRLCLTVMEKALYLLGIEIPERM